MPVQLGRQLIVPLPGQRGALQAGYRRVVQLLVFFTKNVDPVPVTCFRNLFLCAS